MSVLLAFIAQSIADLSCEAVCGPAHSWLTSLPENCTPESAWCLAEEHCSGSEWQDWVLARLRFRETLPVQIGRVVRLAPTLVARLPHRLRRTLPETGYEEHNMAFFAALRGDWSPFPLHPADEFTIRRIRERDEALQEGCGT